MASPPLPFPSSNAPPKAHSNQLRHGTLPTPPWPRDANNNVPIPFCYTNSSTYHATVPYFTSAISMITSALETDEPSHALSLNVLYHKDQYGNDAEPIYCNISSGTWNNLLPYSTVVIQKKGRASSSVSVGYPAPGDQGKRCWTFTIRMPGDGEPDVVGVAHEVRKRL